MTREEIKYASKDYVKYLLDKQEYHNEDYTEYDIQQAFEKGAQWADNHPINVWHDVSEEPENGKIILLEVVNTIPQKNEVRYFVEYVEEWIVNLMETDGFQSRWAYISDLLPKGSEE